MKTKSWMTKMSVVLLSMFTFAACDNTELSTTNISADDYAYYAALFTGSEAEEVDETTNESDLKLTDFVDRCFSVSITPNENGNFWPRKWTISYAADGCTDPHGNVRKGAILFELTNYWKIDSSLRTVQYNDYYFNDDKFLGTLSIENTGMNEDSLYTFRRKFENGVISKGDSAQMNWDCEKYVVMSNGYATWEFADDEYDVTGGATGVDFEGLAFTMQIAQQLHYRTGCFFPVSGVLTIETEGKSTATIDFGNGDCDNLATLTVDGESTEIEL